MYVGYKCDKCGEITEKPFRIGLRVEERHLMEGQVMVAQKVVDLCKNCYYKEEYRILGGKTPCKTEF